MRKLFHIVLAAALLLIACKHTPEELSVADYVSWIENSENGLHTNKSIGDYEFDLQYKPAEYVVLRENMIVPGTKMEMTLETQQISDLDYFTLRVSRTDGLDPLKGDLTDPDAYSSRVVYFTSAMQNDIKLLCGADTLPCYLFHYEPTDGIDRRATFLVGFPHATSSASGGKTFLFEAREFGTGPILLTIDEESINNIPLIKYN